MSLPSYRDTQSVCLGWLGREHWPPSEQLMAWVPEGRGWALELGCFHGATTECLRQKGYSVLGVDLFHELLARAVPGPWYAVGDMHAIPCRANSLDILLFDNGIEHSWLPGLVLHEIYRVLRPGGHLYTMLPLAARRSSPAHLWGVKTVEELQAVFAAVWPALVLEECLSLDVPDGPQVLLRYRKESHA